MLWRKFFHKFPKPFRFTLAEKIDNQFILLIEQLYTAQFQKGNLKMESVSKAVITIDILKLFLQIAWETKDLDNQKFTELSKQLIEVSKMLSGWQKYLKQKLPL